MAQPQQIKELIDYCLRPAATLPELRLGAVIALCAASCSRKADVLRLRLGCIKKFDNRFEITFWISKTDQHRLGHRKDLSRAADQMRFLEMIERYLFVFFDFDTLAESDAIFGAPLFSKIQYRASTKDHEFEPLAFGDPPLTTAAIDSSFRQVKTILHLPDWLTLHGLRVFAATAALRQGIPVEEVKRFGHWLSDAISMYHEPTEQERLTVSEAVAQYGGAHLLPVPDWWKESTGSDSWEIEGV